MVVFVKVSSCADGVLWLLVLQFSQRWWLVVVVVATGSLAVADGGHW